MDRDHLKDLANLSIRRGTGFGLLAVASIMVSFAFDPYRPMMSGAILLTGIAIILFVRAFFAPKQNYKDTEVWMLVEERPKLPGEVLRRMIGGVMEERYFWHAKIITYGAIVLWAVALLILFFDSV